MDPRSGYPIYLQIVEQIQRAVAVGRLTPGEQLPTVKQLASDLLVNPSTIARALRELEHLGIVDSLAGRGSWVRRDGATAAASRVAGDAVASALAAAVREARALGVDRTQLRDLFTSAVETWYRDDA